MTAGLTWFALGAIGLLGGYFASGELQKYRWGQWQHHFYGISSILLILCAIAAYIIALIYLIGEL